MLTNSFAIFAVVLGGQTPSKSFYHDFRDGSPLPAELELFGPGAQAIVIPEPGGLRIKLPTAGRLTRGWGVALRDTLTGDFEVTASYELLALDRPTRGAGAGIALNALPNSHSSRFTKIGRFVHSDGDNLFKAELSDKERPNTNEFNGIPATTRTGQLRLARTGSVMHYLVTNALGGEFHEVAAWKYGTDDLSMVRFIANNNGSPTDVDARLLDLMVSGRTVPRQTLKTKDLIWLGSLVGLPVALFLIMVGRRLAKRFRGSGQ